MELEHLISAFNLRGEPPDPESIWEYAKQIHEFFKNPLDISKLDQYLGLSFPVDDGLSAFLLDKLTNKKYNASKEQLLLVMKLILSNQNETWKLTTFPFCRKLMDLANMYWRNGSELAKHQLIALDCLIALLENYGEELGEIDFDLNNLYWELLPASEKSSYQPTVRGKIFHLLGLLASRLHNTLFSRQETFSQLLQHILTTLKRQVDSRDAKLEVAILLGCLKAMDKILLRLGSKVDQKDVDKLYTILEQIIDPKCSIANKGTGQYHIKRREFQRAGLEVIANNAKYFGKHLYRYYEQWYNDLITWCKSSNMDDNAIGRKAMYTFLESVAECTKAEAEDMQTDSHEKFVSYFLGTFEAVFSSNNAGRNELLIAIKGVGLLCSSCSNDSQKIDRIFDKIMELINRIVVELNSPVTNKYGGSLSLVSAYLESVGSILPYISATEADGNISSKFLAHLNTIEQLAVQLMTFYPDLNERSREFAHNSVLLIADSLRVKHNQFCLPFVDRIINLALSHVISSPTQAELDILVESWNKRKANNTAIESKKAATSQLRMRGVKSYTYFWTNLTRHGSGSTVELLYDSVIQWGLSTIGKLDLTMIFDKEGDRDDGTSGVGDITSTMTANVLKDFHLFVNLVEFFQIFIPKSNELLFEKWVEVFITEIILLIELNPFVSGFYKILTVTLNMARRLQYFKPNNAERESLFGKCNTFLKSVTSKINEFRDDLLLAVLELWLSTPDQIIIQNLNSLSETLKIIFGMGRTCFGLAEHCIEAIERWIVMKEFPPNEIERLIQNLFPAWQTYFVSTGMESAYLEERARKKIKSNTKLANKRQAKRLKLIYDELEEATLKKVQLKLLHLIGSFGHLLDFDNNSITTNVLRQEDRFLKYAVPFQDIKPDVYLDSLLPRVLELCKNSGERQIRTSACETLHSFVLYFLGYACRSNNSNENIELFSKIFHTIILLGCDGDVLVRQLFNPLAIQSVHWFTKPNNAYGNLILQIIVDGLVQSENAALGDFSAACISEFFNWALKHDNQGMSNAVLHFIEALSTHAAPQYRLGAVVGFNSLYKEFRANKELCSKYTITLLVSFVTNLALSSEFEADSALIKTTRLAISHLERIMIKYKDAFNVMLSGRKKPADIPSATPCLKDVLGWLLVQVGRTEVICREESVRLLRCLSSHVRGLNSLQSFLVSFETTNGYDRFINLAEKSKDSLSLDSTNDLLKFLDTASEFYSVLGDCELLKLSTFKSGETSAFLSCYKKFLQLPIDSICEKYWKITTRILCRYAYFKKYFDDAIVDELFLDFSISVSQKFYDYNITVALVNIWNTCKLKNRIKLKAKFHLNLDEQLEEETNSEVLSTVKWLTVVAENKFLPKLFDQEEIENFSTALWSLIDKSLYQLDSSGSLQTVVLSKTREEVLEWLLRLHLALDVHRKEVLDAPFDQTSVDVKTNYLQKSTKGDVFQEVMLQVLIRCEEMLDFSNLLNKCKIEKVGSIVEGFLSVLKKKRSLKAEIGGRIFEKVISSWRLLSVNCDRHTVARILSGLAFIDLQKCRDSRILTDWWCGSELMNAQHLNLKEKSEFIGFLGLFALSKQPNVANLAIEAVGNLTKKDFNSEIIWIKEEGYITKMLLQILSVFEKLPKQLKLLEFLILLISKSSNMAGSDSDPPVFKEIKKRLVRLVKKEQVEQNKICSCIYETLFKYEDCRRNLTTCKLCLIPLLASTSARAAKIFFTEHIFSIIDRANSEVKTTVEDWNSKTIAFNLLEMLAHTTSIDFIKGQELLDLYHAKLRNEGVDNLEKHNVSKAVITACVSFKKNAMPSTLNSLMRHTILQCNYASYNAVAANLIATKASERFLEGILIHEDPIKNNILWANIVDCELEYNFPVVLNENVGTRRITFSKTNEDPSESDLMPSPQQQIGRNNQNMMNLAESSLASEGMVYDFTPLNNDNAYYEGHIDAEEQYVERDRNPNIIPDVDIEWNEVNRHACMVAFVATIKQLKLLSAASGSSDACPSWITYLEKALKSSQHINVKIFIIGILLNCHEIISPFAKHFIHPILTLIVDPTKDNFGTQKLNHFVTDIIAMFLSWSKIRVPDEEDDDKNIDKKDDKNDDKNDDEELKRKLLNDEELKRKLLNYVIQNVETGETRQDVYHQNLNFIRMIVERWELKENNITSEIIQDIFRTNSNPKIGLAVSQQILLAGKLPILDSGKLMKEFCRALKNSSKPIYCDAAENIGLLLKHLRDTKSADIEKALEFVRTRITGEKTRPLVFLTILGHLKKHSPSEVTHFKLEILGFLNIPSVRAEAISLLTTCFNPEIENDQYSDANKKEATENFFADLEGRQLFKNPCTTLQEAETGLEIFEVLMVHLTDTVKLMKILTWVKILEGDDADGKFRARYARCVFNVYKLIKASGTSSLNSTAAEQTLLKVFVRLFRDKDPLVKVVVNEFWSNILKRWNETPMLILELMEIVGDQENAIEITVGLIMKRCSAAPDFRKDIFDKPLEDCTFYKYDLDTSWRMRHASFQPLFAESLSSSQNFSKLPAAIQNSILSQRRSVGQFGVNLLRATLSLANQRFTPTQQQVNSVEFQAMEIDSGDEYQFLSPERNASLVHAAETSLSISQTKSDDPLASLRKRFYHRPDSGFFAMKEVERQKARVVASIEAVKMKRSNVKLSRSYRVGELPDILIKHSDLLKTISTLAKLDDEIGRSFLVIIFTSMMDSVDRPGPGTHQKSKNNRFKCRAQEVFENLLRNHGRKLKPNFAATLLEISILNDIPIQPSHISDVCSHLDLHELGILELEISVLESDSRIQTSTASKRAKADSQSVVPESEDISAWLRIAEFYKDLEEYDVLRNIFSICSSKSTVHAKVYNRTREALALEAVGKVEDALKVYSDLHGKAAKQRYNFATLKFLEDAKYNCLASLSDWGQLYDDTEKFEKKICSDQIFEDTEYVGRILPLAVKSGTQILFEETENVQHILKYKALMLKRGDDVLKFLSSQYPIEMGVLMLSQDFQNTAKSATLLEKGWDMGVKEFQLFHRLSLSQRREKALMLQQASVLQDTLTWSKGLGLDNVERKTKALTVKLERLCNYKMASLVNSDMIVAERGYFINKIISNQVVERNEDIVQELKILNFRQHLWVLALGIRDKNVTIANKYLQKSKELGEVTTENEFLEYRKMYTNYLAVFNDHSTTEEMNDWLKMWSSAWKKLFKRNSTLQIDSSDAFQIQGELLRSLIQGTLGRDKEQLVNAGSKTLITESLLGKTASRECSSIKDAAIQRSQILITNLSNHTFENNSKADLAYLQLSRLLKVLSKSFPQEFGEDESLLRLMLKCLLRSMASDSNERLLLFPRILALLEKFQFLHQTFIDNVTSVPTWIFLPWLDQIVTSYRSSDLSLQTVFSPILVRLKETYPHAFQLQYSDLLTKETSDFQETYSKSLKALVLPIILHKKFVDGLERCKVRKNVGAAKKMLIEFSDNLKIYTNKDIYGKIHNEYASEMSNFVQDALEKLSGDEAETCSEGLSQTMSNNTPGTTDLAFSLSNVSKFHQEKVRETMKSKGSLKPINLKDLAPWLDKFHHTISNEELEIPGLYDGLCKPDVTFHPKVVSFHSTVGVYSSLTRPIKYTMIGNNGKKLDFLAKHGDDLRQDRRIQQLFRVSNKLFNEDCKTLKRKLHLITYSVIPLTEIFGIMEMVTKTTSLGAFICSSESLKTLRIKSATEHYNWITATSGLEFANSAQYFRYLNSAKKASRGDAEREFNTVASSIPRNLLRDHLQERAGNLEQFFKVRQDMVRSYAAMCIVHWLLGIGDRHLENCLLSLETGYLVGIDFGSAFGAGNTALEIPEMIPFRLTPQIQSLMSPYGCKGLFKETMLCGWRCLINSSDMLLSIIDVFVNERNIDWLKERKGQQGAPSRNEKWVPLIVMEKKLKCQNPVKILLDELASNRQKTLIPVYSAVVTDGRAELLQYNQLTDEGVIDALIDMATDKNILARHYHGLCSWI